MTLQASRNNGIELLNLGLDVGYFSETHKDLNVGPIRYRYIKQDYVTFTWMHIYVCDFCVLAVNQRNHNLHQTPSATTNPETS